MMSFAIWFTALVSSSFPNSWLGEAEWILLATLCVVLGGLLLAALARATVLTIELLILAIVRNRGEHWGNYRLVDESRKS